MQLIKVHIANKRRSHWFMYCIPRTRIMTKFGRHFRYMHNTPCEFGSALDLIHKALVRRDQ